MKNVIHALAAATSLLALTGCEATVHPVTASSIGVASDGRTLESVVDQPGPVTVETVAGADWAVARSGLINLDHPKAKEAGLTDGDEAIQIYFHAIRHPSRGLFLVDTGTEHQFRDDPDHALVHGLLGSLAHIDKLKVRVDTASWLAKQREAPKGVFLTHLHFDHITGMRDVPASSEVYLGAGEAEASDFTNFFVAGATNTALEGKRPLREWRFVPDPSGSFDGIIDVFGDRSVFAISVPGHTPGSVAYLARTPNGPVLLTGDACHTVWGWQHGVEPGSFSSDKKKSAESLAKLEALVVRHPGIDVRLGHQQLPRVDVR